MGSAPRLPGAPGEVRGLAPDAPLRGSLPVPGSKSIAQRALLAAALAAGASRLRGLPAGADVRAARDWLAGLGIASHAAADEVVLQGRGLPLCSTRGSAANLDAHESATLARCGTAVLALCGTPATEQRVTAGGSLRERGHAALWDALGARVLRRGWPTVLRAGPPAGALHLVAPSSSQEVSALLIALAAHPGRQTLTVEGELPSRPYVELTRRVLEHFGVRSTTRTSANGETFEVEGPLVPATLEIEPDASLAAVALAAGCLSGGAVTVPGLGAHSAQGDIRIARHLQAFGCSVRWTSEGLWACGRPTRGVDLDLAGEPDLAPVLAVVAADAATRGHSSRLSGLGTLPGKESSRIQVLAAGLGACGWRALGDTNSLVLEPGAPTSGAVLLDPHGDHRMAFAFALAGLCRAGVSVAQAGCTAKSWPGFWGDLAGLVSPTSS